MTDKPVPESAQKENQMSDYRNKMAFSAREFESIQAIVEQAITDRATAFGWVRGRFYQAYPGGRTIDYTETVPERKSEKWTESQLADARELAALTWKKPEANGIHFPWMDAAIELACQRNALLEAMRKAEIGLMLCNPLPGYDMATLHVVRAAIRKATGGPQ